MFPRERPLGIPYVSGAIILLVLTGIIRTAFAGLPYVPAPGSPERRALMEALRAGWQQFPALYSLGLPYQREEVKFRPEFKVLFQVDYLKVKDDWAWIEVRGQNFDVSLYALLHQGPNGWQPLGLVEPRYMICPGGQDCLDVRSYVQQHVHKTFPEVPLTIFPPIHPDFQPILAALRDKVPLPPEDIVFVVRHLRVKDRWAWVEAHPRSKDGQGQYEPVAALLRQEKGGWQVKTLRLGGCNGAAGPHRGDIKR